MNLTSSAELAVRLVNSAYQAPGLPDPLGTVSDFSALTAGRPELPDAVTLADLEALRAARTELSEIFTAAAGGRDAVAAAALNGMLARAPIHPELARHEDQQWHVHLAEHGAAADKIMARVVFAVTLIVGRYGMDRLGVCAIASCPRVFLDASPNSSRRYCAECAARANVTAIRARAGQGRADGTATAAG